MRSNESAFYWLLPTTGNAERRDYPIRVESPILSMTDVIWSPPYPRDSEHVHNCMEIGLCLSGSGVIGIAGHEPHSYASGTVVVVPEGVRHCQQCQSSDTSRWRYIAVDEARLLRETTPRCREEIGRLIGKAKCGGVCLSGKSVSEDIAWLIEKMFDLKCRFSDDATAELEAILLLILTRIAREPQGLDVKTAEPMMNVRSVEPALLYVAERYRQEIRIDQLARSCAMSESHFRKVFLQVMGMPPVEYINRYRIERAVHLISSRQDMSVSRIAEECGFTSIATFNRNFVRYTGQNPTKMRKGNANLRESAGDKIVQNQ